MFFNRKQPLLSCKFFFIFLGGGFHKGNFLVGHFSQGSYFTMGIFSWRGIFWRGFSCFRFIRFFKHCSNGAKCFALVLTEIEIVLLNMPYIIATSRSSHRRWSIEKGILIYFVNFAGIHLFWSLFLKKFRKPFWRISASGCFWMSLWETPPSNSFKAYSFSAKILTLKFLLTNFLLRNLLLTKIYRLRL